MKRRFAALRFCGDANLSNRTYWYLAPFPVKAGDEVLAPVGMRDRLQRALVERTLAAEDSEAPYDVRLCKSIASRYGDRVRAVGGVNAREFGGVRYDEKHYTRLGQLLISDEVPKESTGDILEVSLSDMDIPNALRTLIASETCVLICGKGARELGLQLVHFARGEAALPLTEEELSLLAEKLL